MNIDITPSVISQIIPRPGLNDLGGDLDNDIQIVLDWLSPYYPDQHTKVVDPTIRVKKAIHSYLKHESNQMEFIMVYINTIACQFDTKFVLSSDVSFMQYIQLVKQLLFYYNCHLDYLNLTTRTRSVFTRKLNLLISNKLSHTKLQQYFVGRLFGDLSSELHLELIDVITTLNSIGLTAEVHHTMIQLSISTIKQNIQEIATGKWTVHILKQINNYITTRIYPTFSLITSYTESPVVSYLSSLTTIAHVELVHLRINEIYSMVSTYPSSIPALEELYLCLSTANKRRQLTARFIESIRKNLLHSGADTIDIIHIYMKTMRSFLIIDPRGVLLDQVIRPIRKYLKTRDDVIIKLVHGLLDNDPNSKLYELSVELTRKQHPHSIVVKDDGLKWTPDPIDALADFKRGKHEVIESLLSIFTSKEVFIDEFTRLFGKLLIQGGNVLEIEAKLTLLKSRFGNDLFTMLDIMIRDIKQSNQYHQGNLQMSVLSHLYWPDSILEQDQDTFNVPDVIQTQFDQFKTNFINDKPGRTVKHIPNLGSVTLELEINNESRQFKVTPLQAAIIDLFNGEKDEVSIDYVAEKLDVNSYTAGRGLNFWVDEKVLIKLTNTLYMVNE
ncbi:Anaphase-promoting complex subunit 2 [Spathaspora sp. JA1]|nr:Anaphase-promoting complex subunit 2 [Spathaspora sp. JA1]